jgi:all-trans-nonaprenyl-diphosphate synthase
LIDREFKKTGDLERALDIVRSSQAIPRTRELAEKFARESRESIAWMADSPSKRALFELPDFVLSRLY